MFCQINDNVFEYFPKKSPKIDGFWPKDALQLIECEVKNFISNFYYARIINFKEI